MSRGLATAPASALVRNGRDRSVQEQEQEQEQEQAIVQASALLPQRKLQRLPGYDYSQPGAYFITINAHRTFCRTNLFGAVVECGMELNAYGDIVQNQWLWLFSQYQGITAGRYVVMPDHFHAVIHLEGVESGKQKPLPQIIGAFKTTSSKQIHLAGMASFKWHKSYHDRIIRNEEELHRIEAYIQANPERWQNGEEEVAPHSPMYGASPMYGTVATVPYIGEGFGNSIGIEDERNEASHAQ